jgi:hypothetical protein
MLRHGVSPLHPDPLEAIAEAKRAKRKAKAMSGGGMKNRTPRWLCRARVRLLGAYNGGMETPVFSAAKVDKGVGARQER